jgi:hypothetical protein
MSDLDWWLPAVGAGVAAVAVLITAAHRMRRRRRNAGAPTPGDRRIEIVEIDERKSK